MVIIFLLDVFLSFFLQVVIRRRCVNMYMWDEWGRLTKDGFQIMIEVVVFD